MIIRRQENWGIIEYDTEMNQFFFKDPNGKIIDSSIYPMDPLVINVDITFKCNMKCIHCVSEDMAKKLGGRNNADLIITDELIKRLIESPFMLIVLTGGEPLYPETINGFIKLLRGIKDKGIIIDTNGTIFPEMRTLNLIKKKQALVRVSWDILHPEIEVKLRKYPKGLYSSPEECMAKKVEFIKYMTKHGIRVAIQSVLHQNNCFNDNFQNIPYKLKELGIKDWYIQRFIPSHKAKNHSISSEIYEKEICAASKIAKRLGIRLHTKKDKRHNSVFLLVKDGILFTQSDKKPGEKIEIGEIGDNKYFQHVSNSDHFARYL